jgi:myo-inositol 2-dehydrogenase/D-chiro-inositol 1-dehydrogenase
MRLGLIGLGRIGAFHAQTLTALPVVDSLVVTDAVPALTAEVAGRLGAEAADSPEALLAARVDGVVEAAGVRVHIGYQRRFDAAFQAARAAVASGELGWLLTVRATTLDPAPPPAAYVAVSGGIFRDCSVHDFDIIRWVTGREVVEVYATGANRGDELFVEAGDVDTSAAVLTLDDGTLVLVSNTRYNPRGHDVRMELHGSKDSIAVGLDDHLPLRSVEPGVSFPAGEPYQFFMDRFLPAYRAELQAFTEVVAGRRPSPCTVADALEAGWIAEACTTSLQQHRPVRMEEVRT